MKNKDYEKLADSIAQLSKEENEEELAKIFIKYMFNPDFDIDKLDYMVRARLERNKET